MRREKSWTREQYRQTYRRMRRGFSFEYLLDNLGVPNEVVKAADYSYQAAHDGDAGWISSIRRARFYAIKYRVLATTEGVPF